MAASHTACYWRQRVCGWVPWCVDEEPLQLPVLIHADYAVYWCQFASPESALVVIIIVMICSNSTSIVSIYLLTSIVVL